MFQWYKLVSHYTFGSIGTICMFPKIKMGKVKHSPLFCRSCGHHHILAYIIVRIWLMHKTLPCNLVQKHFLLSHTSQYLYSPVLASKSVVRRKNKKEKNNNNGNALSFGFQNFKILNETCKSLPSTENTNPGIIVYDQYGNRVCNPAWYITMITMYSR